MKNLLLITALCTFLPPGTGPRRYPDADLVYGSTRSEIFRKHRVRAVLLEQEPLGPAYGGRPARLISREEIDRQGRVSSEETAENQSFLTQRRDFEYSPAGVQVAQTVYERAETKPDTVRTAPAWLPVLHTRTVAEADQPAGSTRWNRETGLWEPIDRVRGWTSHDTTYAETRSVATGRRTLLTRTYYTGPGKQIMRFDVLPYTGSGLGEPQYQYYRFEHNSPVESGMVSYEKELAAYRAQNPTNRHDEQHARNEALDQLARRSAGTYQPSGKGTYTPQGQLLTMDMFEVLTTYQRDKQGRALNRRMGIKNQRKGQLTTYTYRTDGLLATETEALEFGPPLQISRYRYLFY
jgi:hypothetical protein